MTKVLIVSDHFSHGGVASSCKNLTIGLIRNGYEVHLLCSFIDRIDIDMPTGITVDAINTKGWQRKLILPIIRKLNEYFKYRDFDIVISNKDHVNFLIALMKYIYKYDFQLICNSHNTVSEIYKNSYSRMYRIMLRTCPWIYKKSVDVLANVSLGSCKDSEEFFKFKHVHYLPNPVFDELPDTISINPFFYKNSINILACGRLVKQKNYDLMLRVLEKLLILRDDIHLTILGDGSCRKELEALIQSLGIEKHVTLKGAVNNVGDYMNHSEFLWMTSYYEGFGMVIVEALSHGCPVVSVNCPHGPKEIIGDNCGLIIDSFSIEDNVEAISKFLDSEEKSNDTYQHRALDFSIDSATDKYIELFK